MLLILCKRLIKDYRPINKNACFGNKFEIIACTHVRKYKKLAYTVEAPKQPRKWLHEWCLIPKILVFLPGTYLLEMESHVLKIEKNYTGRKFE